MTIDHRLALLGIKRFDQLIAYLRDELGWPISRDSFDDVDDLFYDFSAEELGIDPKTAAKIQEIKRLRPLSAKQPWGIFFVKFEPKKLPVVVLRRILSQVALKKRESANSSERTAWSADDLLFISNYGEGDERQISFAHFSQPVGTSDLPTLRVLGWNNLDTPLHLDAVAAELTQNLRWPNNDQDLNQWRKSWSNAFKLGHNEVINTAKVLSVRLAELASSIRDRIKIAISIESENGPLTKLMKAFQSSLVHDLDINGFADMYAQTIAYGLLSARITDPSKKTVDDFTSHMKTSPFLKELLETFLHIGGRRGRVGEAGIDFDELGVGDVINLLDNANMEAVVRDFGDRNRQEDPVMHFFEGFLQAYDSKIRKDRGVFYTPQPVVSYIVRSVHEALQSEFGLSDGLADTATWGEMIKRHPSIKIPSLQDGPNKGKAISPDEPFIKILDPATGTATFIVEAIDIIYRTLSDKWTKQGWSEKQKKEAWNVYVPIHLLPRLHAYELMMAPYAIAHMKVGLKLAETGYNFLSDERARIYLTNALEPPFKQMPLIGFGALAHEALAVNVIKSESFFTVVVGNPPYSVMSGNLSEEARLLVDDFRNAGGKKIVERSMLRLEMHLQDDYVKFIALGQKYIKSSGIGLFSLITNNGYLDNLTLRGVRSSLLDQFNSLTITNLHGNRLRQTNDINVDKDENVFDINQGVCIFLAQQVSFDKVLPKLRYIAIKGFRNNKYQFLNRLSLHQEGFIDLVPVAPQFFLVPTNSLSWDEYSQFDSLVDIMPVNISGIVTAHDDLVVDFDDKRLIKNLDVLCDTSLSDEVVRSTLSVKDNVGWKLSKARSAVRSARDDKSSLKNYSYRPFDIRRIYYDSSLVWSDRKNVMSHILNGNNWAIATCRQLAELPWHHVFVTEFLQDDCYISNRTRERSYHFPVELKGGGKQRSAQADLLDFDLPQQLNLSQNFLSKLNNLKEKSSAVKETAVAKVGNLAAFYIYAILNSTNYRAKYGEFLKVDFPRIPTPKTFSLFQTLSKLGIELVSIHLMKVTDLNLASVKYFGANNQMVIKPSWIDGNVYIDSTVKDSIGQVGFSGVSEDVWNFQIGCYKVCEKWLKDRKGRALSNKDIEHYRKIIISLSETMRIMEEIDRAIDDQGGWPGAFKE